MIIVAQGVFSLRGAKPKGREVVERILKISRDGMSPEASDDSLDAEGVTPRAKK